MPRQLPPTLAFRAQIRARHRNHSITQQEAQRALATLARTGTAPEQRAAVQDFLASRGADQLTPRAREALVAFVKAQTAPDAPRAGTDPRTDAKSLKAAAERETREAEAHTARAQARLAALLSSTKTAGSALARGPLQGAVSQATRLLRDASADIEAARTLLRGIARDRTTRTAGRTLGFAKGELEDAIDGLQALLTRHGRTAVKKRDVEAVKRFLRSPLDGLREAAARLTDDGSARRRSGATERFPSDADDTSGGTSTTAKYPSDAEDHGAHPPPPPTGGGYATAKHPSDGEDGGAGQPGPVVASTIPDDPDDP